MPMPKSTRTPEEWREYRRLKMARWREANPERSKANNRRTVATWREANPEANREMKQRSYIANPKSRMLGAAKKRAEKAEVPFDIVADDIEIPTHCPVFGFELVDGGDRNNSPSLDRIKPELGYVKGNIQVISTRANRIKNDATPEEMRRLADFMAKIAA